MPASQKPRKRYRPKEVHLNAAERAISGVRRPSSRQLTTVGVINHEAILALKQNMATSRDWDVVCAAFNIAVVLIEQTGIGAEYLPDLDAGMQALQAVGKRWLTWHKWQLTSEEEDAISLAMEVHDELLKVCTVRATDVAQAEVNNRLRRGKIKYLVKPSRPLTGPEKKQYDHMEPL